MLFAIPRAPVPAYPAGCVSSLLGPRGPRPRPALLLAGAFFC